MHIIKNPYINIKNSKRTEEEERETTKETKKIVIIAIIFIINGHHQLTTTTTTTTVRLQQYNASTDLLRGKNCNQIFVIKHQHIRKKSIVLVE